MNTQRDDQDIVERLQAKTIDGELRWRPAYKSNRPSDFSDQSMKDFTQPIGYILQDQIHGFGVVTVRIEDPENEIRGEPALFVQGEKADASLQDVGILLDAIQTYLNDIREGHGMSAQERIDRRVEKEVAPYEEELARKEAELRQAEEEKRQLLSALEGLASESGGTETPLTVDTFRQTLLECISDEGEVPEAFPDYFDEGLVAKSINQVERTQTE